jgi:predicted  nucleic acid-binding Zn-ribbon protein
MGRAIEMENSIEALKIKVEKLENTVRGMISKIDSLNEKFSQEEYTDLVEEVGTEIEDNKEKNEEKEANNKRDGKSNKQSNNKSRKSNKKNV